MFAFGGGIYYDMYILYKGGEDMRVLIVGGGAAGLCCAIRLRQLDPALQVTVLERLEDGRALTAGAI